MKKSLQSKSGLTLIELVIAMAVSMIVMGAAVYIFTFGFQIYNKAGDTYNAHTLALFTQQKIEAEVSYAGSMRVDTNPPASVSDFSAGNNRCLYVSGGRLKCVKADAGGLVDQYTYMQGNYSGLNLTIVFNPTAATNSMVLDVTIKVYKGSSLLYQTHSDIMINNLDPSLNPSPGSAFGIDDQTALAGGSAVEFSVPNAGG